MKTTEGLLKRSAALWREFDDFLVDYEEALRDAKYARMSSSSSSPGRLDERELTFAVTREIQ
ncbi:MAG: hypothetical protein OXL34_15195 [Gemmatimonadota bacterium]|nr:hypothetical protein [Gemmatimonadota bacterium]